MLLVAAAGLYCGWRLHWFLTDDAFIAFRFIDNRRAGFGYTWNPPPYRPVEGYTSFAWIVLLDVIWSVFGIEPPAIANDISLVCSVATLALTSWASHRLCQLRGVSGVAAVGLTAAVLFSMVSNRTFLVWSSSGLETALFNLLLQGWVLCGLVGFARGEIKPRTLGLCCALASAIALTRPDGFLPVACSAAMVAVCLLLRLIRVGVALRCLSPLLLVAAHLAWRHSFYGQWLPNTYYAKVVAPWPQAGAMYLLAFVLEYAYYLPIPIWLVGLWAWARAARSSVAAADGVADGRLAASRVLLQVGVLATLSAMLGFEVLIAGGDHFEYRALSFLVSLCTLATLYGCFALELRVGSTGLALAGFAAISAVLPWASFAQQNALTAWPAKPQVLLLAPEVPFVLRPIAHGFDSLEAWLIPHGIGIRHYEHRAFFWHQLRVFPAREEGARACAATDHPVEAIGVIGVAGWVMSGCAILDLRGLADYVVARTPAELSYLGHDRAPPRGYLSALMPNVFVHDGVIRVYPRPTPLTDDLIRDIENTWWNWASEQR